MCSYLTTTMLLSQNFTFVKYNYSQIWQSYQIRDIFNLERLQYQASKFISNYPITDYKAHATSLSLLPLMMQYEINDIFCSAGFNILKKFTSLFDVKTLLEYLLDYYLYYH